MSQQRKSKVWLWAVAIVALAVVGWGAGPGGWFDKTDVFKLRGQKVQRGPLEISVLQRGNLDAHDSASITSEIEGTTTVLYLIKEGSFAKEGDLLVELDSSALIEKKVAQEIGVQNADAAFKKAKASYEIQDSQNRSDIEAAERKLRFARLDLDKYEKGDFAQLTETADQKILLAQAELQQSDTTYTWSKTLNDKGFLTRSELDRDELERQRSDISLKQAERAKQILLEYEDPRQRAELDANVKEAERGLERAKLRAEAQLTDVGANLKSCDAKLKLEQEKLDKYVAQLAKTKIRAPASGMIVYTRQEGRGMGGDQPMQEGSQVRERQEILTIPREGGMIVEASIHESVLKQVTVGAPCTIRVDAAPGKEFFGKVSFVALLPDKGSWWANPNLRLYKTEIVIDRPAPGSEAALKDLRPGMSCAIEIHSARIEDAIYVPLQAVFIDKGESIAFVTKDDTQERRVLQVGRSNDKFVEILDGLKEGEEVLLSAPPGFSPSGADDAQREGGPRGPRQPGTDGTSRAPGTGAAPGTSNGASAALPGGDGAAPVGGASPAGGGADAQAPGGLSVDGQPPGGRRTGGRSRDGAGGPGGGRRGGPGRPARDQTADATTTGTAEKTDAHDTGAAKGDGKQR